MFKGVLGEKGIRIALLYSLLIYPLLSFSQSYEYVYNNPADSTYNCYLTVHPNTETIKGLMIRDYSNLPDVSKKSPYQFSSLCADAGLMVLYTNSSNIFPELFISDHTMKILDKMVNEVIKAHDIPKDNIFIGGISASGARALRYAQYCAQGKSKVKIKGVFSVDSPLDLERFYYSAKKHQHNFKAGMLWEANHMIPYFQNMFSGGPDQFYEAYKQASVYTQTDSLGGNAMLLKDTDIILFHEPDIDWWLHERGATYYDFNSYDIAAFALTLKMLGNESVQLITTSGKGFDRKGNRNCHSWTIVDEVYLINWIKERLD